MISQSFPLIYCNGDSYSDANYHCSLQDQTYAHCVGRHLGGFVINRAMAGSCNRRIIRSACHDLLLQRELNPCQPIIALISFSFEIRDEIWIDDTNRNTEAQESNFINHQFSSEPDWKQNLVQGQLAVTPGYPQNINRKFLHRWSEGRAWFYSPYAERINFLMDVMLFKSLLQQHNVQYLMFQGPLAEKLQPEYLLDFFKSRTRDPNVLDFETFSFCGWCDQRGFAPLDIQESRHIAHYGPDAHQAFANDVIMPWLDSIVT